MREYRLYCLDKAGKIGFAETIEATDDQDAVSQARKLKHSALKCEVWQGRRLVLALSAQELAGLSH
jgi:hypothetical protein